MSDDDNHESPDYNPFTLLQDFMKKGPVANLPTRKDIDGKTPPTRISFVPVPQEHLTKMKNALPAEYRQCPELCKPLPGSSTHQPSNLNAIKITPHPENDHYLNILQTHLSEDTQLDSEIMNAFGQLAKINKCFSHLAKTYQEVIINYPSSTQTLLAIIVDASKISINAVDAVIRT